MGNFRQGGGNRFGGGHGGRGGGGFGGRGGSSRPNFRGPVSMHKVTCDECKKPCEVPFLPTAGKPVYCNACFGGKKGTGNDRFAKKGFNDYKTPPRTDFGNDISKVSGAEIKKQIEVLNGKIDKLTKIIEGMTTNNKSILEEGSKEIVGDSVKAVIKEIPVVKIKKAVKKVSKK